MEILLADDHDLVRDAIGSLLTNADENIRLSMVEDLVSALAMVRKKKFDVIILDLRMPGMNGLVGAQKMLRAVDNVPVIILSGQAGRSDVRTALKLGVKGFVPKTLAGKSLINAVKLVASGETYCPIDFLSNQKSNSSNIYITKREEEVLCQLRSGNSNKEISRILEIAETTVKLHIRSLTEKFSARNRTDLVVKAIDKGIA